MSSQAFLTPDELALRFKTKKARIYELVRLGLLPAVHLGRQLRFDEAQISEFIKQGGKSLAGGWRKEAR
jgi:excisionase family DNA binding protein